MVQAEKGGQLNLEELSRMMNVAYPRTSDLSLRMHNKAQERIRSRTLEMEDRMFEQMDDL
jgi:hypothetical protein